MYFYSMELFSLLEAMLSLDALLTHTVIRFFKLNSISKLTSDLAQSL